MYPNNLYYPYHMTNYIPHIRPITSQFPIKPNLFTRIGNTFGTIKNINWSNIINNTSKTLNVINQAIPIVKQTGPMIHNMRSMLKVASAFRDETNNKKKNKPIINNNIKKEVEKTDDSLPNFFV